jgi:DNA polymerase III epsilon subunit-like protein
MRDATVFFDLETAGLEDKHADIQLAAVAIRNWEEVGTFEAKIQFDAHEASPEALAINHYDPDVWAQYARPEADVVKDFGKFLRENASLTKTSKAGNPYSVARLAGHNAASFDAPRLYRMFRRHGKSCPADIFRPLDTMQLALWHFSTLSLEPQNYKLGTLAQIWHFSTLSLEPRNYKLGTLAETLGIEQTQAHDALSDVRTTIAIAKTIITYKEEKESPF